MTIRCVLFDAVGTLLEPWPSAVEAYAQCGAQFGYPLSAATIAARFKTAFQRQETEDAASFAGQTSPQRERERWAKIVADVFVECSDATPLFDHLWNHFAEPHHWRVYADVAPAIGALTVANIPWGIASNLDTRLRTVLAGTAGLAAPAGLFISAELGWRKPARAFFAAIETTLQLQPTELLLVGDDVQNDDAGARAAGWHSQLIDRTGRVPHSVPSLLDAVAAACEQR